MNPWHNIFKNQANEIISHAFLISDTQIQLFLKKKKSNFKVHLYAYDYNFEEEGGFHLEKIHTFDIQYVLESYTLHYTINLTKNYVLSVDNEFTNVILSPTFGGILDTVFAYNHKDNLGLHFTNEKAVFRFWSPPTCKANLLLYNPKGKRLAFDEPLPFIRKTKGILEIEIDCKLLKMSSLHGLQYNYEIFAYGKKTIALCPYAKAMVPFNFLKSQVGRGVIVDIKKPKKLYRNEMILTNPCKMVAYETHIRDFTIQPNLLPPDIGGTFAGFVKKINYLVNLGITHVQLMPVNKCFTQNDLAQQYTGKDSKIYNYNWGYDVYNYFTPEGRYSSDPKNPQKRIEELQQLAKKLHKNKIGLIYDVVFNHTFKPEIFENIAPGCYYRLNKNLDISDGTGAGATLESRRKSIRTFIIDVLIYYVEFFGADGFRFDLMGFHDHETMKQIRKEVGRCYNAENINDLILHGEAWNFTDIDDGTEYTMKNLPKEALNIAIFNDTFRDSVSGKQQYCGFIHGNYVQQTKVATGIVAALQTYDPPYLRFNEAIFYDCKHLFTKTPAENINYLSIHDGLTLWDKINLTQKDPEGWQRLKTAKLAVALLFASQGKIIWHGGDEILRSKSPATFDRDRNRTFTSYFADPENGSLYFHENSYRAADYTNMYRWDKLSENSENLASSMHKYVREWMLLRKNIPCFGFENAKSIEKGLRFFQINEEVVNTNKLNIHLFSNPKLEKFSINFYFGMPNQTYYLVGEIHSGNQNPTNNPYKVTFDSQGFAQICFNRAEIETFDLRKWGDNNNLAIKLVKTPGHWDFLPYAYSTKGVNLINPSKISSNFEVDIYLNQRDFWCINLPKSIKKQPFIFSLDNTQEFSKTDTKSVYWYDSFLVVINIGEQYIEFTHPFTKDFKHSFFLAHENSGNTILDNRKGTACEVTENSILITARTAAVIGFKNGDGIPEK